MLKVLELFGGIGACSKALERLKIDFEIIDYVEIDKYAVKSFNAIHNTNFEQQDICTWNKDIEVDLIMHGSPCQDFSLAGKQAGGDKGSGTRSSLMYETIRIVKKIKPKYVVWENVKNILSKKHRHNFENYLEIMENLGYKNYYQVLNAKDYGIPQNRERVFTISIRNDINIYFEFPQKQELKLKLKDMLENNVDEKYYLSDKMISYCLESNQEKSEFNRGERFLQSINRSNQNIAVTISTKAGNRPIDNFIKEKNGIVTQEPYLKIKNCTKKGYLEAYDGDGVDISSRMKYHRGTVQKDMIQTLDSYGGNGKGVVVIKDTPNYIEWEDKGKFVSDCRAFKEEKISGSIVTTSKNKVLLKTKLCNELIKNGKVHEYDVINHSYSNNRMKNLNSKIIESHNQSPTLETRCDCLGVTVNQPPLRIRKLTPKECWRLMGFDDDNFEKASKVCSNTQLYKQAGNSIVVNVLEEIFKKLLL